MKGIIFNLLEDMVASQGGEAAWDELLDAADLDGGYSAIGNYPDTELLALVASAAQATGLDPDEIIRSFGRHALTGLAQRYPQFFDAHDHTRPFLLTLNDVIHPEVRKLHPEAEPPVFDFDTSDPDRLAIGYTSSRRLCVFAEGMIAGAAAHFGDGVVVTQTQCMNDGADRCVIDCTFTDPEGGAGGSPRP